MAVPRLLVHISNRCANMPTIDGHFLLLPINPTSFMTAVPKFKSTGNGKNCYKYFTKTESFIAKDICSSSVSKSPSVTLYKTNQYSIVVGVLSKQFHSTPRRDNPILVQVARVFSILIGRELRKRYRRMNAEERKKFWDKMKRFFWIPVALISSSIGLSGGYILTRLERQPLTKRLRFVAFNKAQIEEITTLELENNLAKHSRNFLKEDSEPYLAVKKIIDAIIKGNQDIARVKEVEWKLHVVFDNSTMNAFVLPNGHIFVFTGILEDVEHLDGISCILGHEMAHCILEHGREKASRGHLLDIFYVSMGAFIWMICGSDLLSFAAQSLFEGLFNMVFDLPYSRELEEEADLVGLQLAAKACFDVRFSSFVWLNYYIKGKLGGDPSTDLPAMELLSTHPLDDYRAQKLNQHIPGALKLRDACNCPPLTNEDPRISLIGFKDFLDSLDFKELEKIRESAKENKLAETVGEIVKIRHTNFVTKEESEGSIAS